jgi:hypothetical protein
MRINPPGQPANRQDGRYMEFGEIPNPGERPVTPLWERPPSNYGGEGDIESNLPGGSGAVTAGHANATTRQVQGAETVAEQLRRLNAGDSAYIRQARQKGAAFAAGRGLLTGSMAAGSAQRAAIDASLPIAAQDASWYGRTAADNMDAQNQVSLANANNDTSASIAAGNNANSLASAILRSRQDREQAALERNYGRERGIWDSEENARTDERRTRLDDWSDERQTGRREGIDTRADYRREGIDTRTDRRRFELDQTGDDIRRRAEARDYAYRSILDGMIQNPEEFDEYMASGIMEFWFGEDGQSAQYFDNVFDEVFGEEP